MRGRLELTSQSLFLVERGFLFFSLLGQLAPSPNVTGPRLDETLSPEGCAPGTVSDVPAIGEHKELESNRPLRRVVGRHS